MLTIDLSGKSRREINRTLTERKNSQLFQMHNDAQRKQQEQRRTRRRQTGVVRLSNMDTISRAKEMRGRLLSKISEIAGSDLEPRARDTKLADIQLLLTRVEQQISAIRRRERAIEAERMARRNTDTPEEKRRRWRDKQERRIYIRRDMLFHADEGGFDPMNPLKCGISDASAPVAFEFSGLSGTVDMPMDMNMEVII